MESYLADICKYADHAHWIFFILFLLSGLNIPISEDLMLIAGGAMASLCIPEHTLRLYVWIFFGSYLSAWEGYGLGHLLGPRLYKIPILKSIITQERLDLLRHYYAKFGIYTFIIGRFCPGGIRNALYFSSGLTKMPFHVFILRDGVACIIATLTLFSLGYIFGENLDDIIFYYKRYTLWFISILIAIIIGALLIFWRLRHQKVDEDQHL